MDETVGEFELELAVSLSYAMAALMLDPSIDEAARDGLRAMWPEGIDPDGLDIGAQVALCCAATFKVSVDGLLAIADAARPQ